MQFYHVLCELKGPLAKYKLRIPETYSAGDKKLLRFDPLQDCLADAEPMLPGRFQEHLAVAKEIHIQGSAGKDGALEEPAYIFSTELRSKKREPCIRTVAR